jgi:hypothetical protein
MTKVVVFYDAKQKEEISPMTSVKLFLSYLSKEVLLGEPDELDALAEQLSKDYIRTVHQIKKMTDEDYDNYKIPKALKLAIKEEVDKIEQGGIVQDYEKAKKIKDESK